MIRGQVGVDHRGLDVGMTHQLHDRGEIDAFHHKVASESVAESVDSGQIFDTSLLGDLDEPFPHLRFELAAVTVGENEVAPESLLVLFFVGLEQTTQLIVHRYLTVA